MRYTKKQTIEYLKINYSVKNKKDIIFDLDTSWSYIQKLCCLNKIKRQFNESENYGKFEKLTDLENLESCYWLGFLLADGHIHKQMNIQMNLSIKDKDHILKLKNFIGNFPIYESPKQIRITISDKKTCKLLSEMFKWDSNKTKNPPSFPNMSNDQLFSLIIGFIDGDGSISSKGIKVKCDKNWKSILGNFYFQLTGINKDFNIQGDNCSIFYLNKLETVFLIKERAEKLNLPLMERKWSRVKKRILKNQKYEIVKHLLNSGKSFQEILKDTQFGEGLIYRVIRENKIKEPFKETSS